MTPVSAHAVRNIVLVGAGHAHALVLRAFALSPIPGISLTLISRQIETPYSGMLPGLIAGHYTFNETHIDTRPLCRLADARLYQSEVTGIDLGKKNVHCANRPPVSYDLLSINIGSTPNTRGIPGAAETAIPVKPIDGFLHRFEAARRRILEKGGRAKICMVGGGAGGVELLLSLETRLRRDIATAGFDPAAVSFTICTAESDILTSFPKLMRRRFRSILKRRGIGVVTGARVTGASGTTLHFDGHGPLTFDEVFWTTQAASAPWLAQTGLKLDAQGFIETRTTLESVSHNGVFAAGDVAAVRCHSIPKAGVYAVRQAPVLAANLRRAVLGTPLRAYHPQREVLFIISTGERYAIATRNGITVEGAWVWHLKDWIDRRFMRSFSQLPKMLAGDPKAGQAPDENPAAY